MDLNSQLSILREALDVNQDSNVEMREEFCKLEKAIVTALGRKYLSLSGDYSINDGRILVILYGTKTWVGGSSYNIKNFLSILGPHRWGYTERPGLFTEWAMSLNDTTKSNLEAIEEINSVTR